MSLPDIRPQANLLSEFVLATLGALGLGFPLRSGSSGSVPDLCVAWRSRAGERFACTRSDR